MSVVDELVAGKTSVSVFQIDAENLASIFDKFFQMGRKHEREQIEDEMKPMSLKETAAFLEKSEKTINNWMNAGYISPSGRLGGSPYFYKFDLREQIKKSRERINK